MNVYFLNGLYSWNFLIFLVCILSCFYLYVFNFNGYSLNDRMEGDEIIRGRGKNKQYWSDEEVKALIEILQELAVEKH